MYPEYLWNPAFGKGIPFVFPEILFGQCDTVLEGDALVARNREEHAITCYRQSLEAARKVAPPPQPLQAVAELSKRQLKRQRQEDESVQQLFKKWTHSGKLEICGLYNKGKCTAVKSDGPSGPHTCSKREHLVHACECCGTHGHPASQCPTPVSCSNKMQKAGKGKSKAAVKGKGEGKAKGKGKGSRW